MVYCCRPYSEHGDEGCCIMVHWMDIDDGSGDPDGNRERIGITAADGVPQDWLESVEICDVGSYAVMLTVTDWCGEIDACDATVDLVDITPPEISAELNRYVLWPPDHKMADIVATVEATDNCDPDPAVTLVSIVSNEPDDAGVEDDLPEALVTRLFPVQPNPFSPSTTIRFSLVTDEHVSLQIYDARGGLVHTLAAGTQPAGVHQAGWYGLDAQGRHVAPGVYFVRFTAGAFKTT